MSYKTYISEISQLLEAQKYRHLWLYFYSSRHAQLNWNQPNKHEESNHLLDATVQLLEKFDPATHQLIYTDENLARKILFDFCFNIVCSYHRRHISDGFLGVPDQDKAAKFDKYIDSLSPLGIDVVSRLHKLSYEYGHLILELWQPLANTRQLMASFATHYPNTLTIPLDHPQFTFIKRGNHPKGIQISTYLFESPIRDDWDLAIFFNDNDKISHIKSQLEDLWKSPETQTVGDSDNYQIALYIDRSKQKFISPTISALELQVDQLSAYQETPYTAHLSAQELDSLTPEMRKRAVRNLQSSIKRLRLSEGLIEKQWGIDQNNVRRAIGLYLWDLVNLFNEGKKSRRSFINEYIDLLRDKAPNVLDLYLHKFNKPIAPDSHLIFGDDQKHHKTVVREMEADYDLAAYCIDKADYFSPVEAKKKRSK